MQDIVSAWLKYIKSKYDDQREVSELKLFICNISYNRCNRMCLRDNEKGTGGEREYYREK